MPTKPPTFRPPRWASAPNKRPEAHVPYADAIGRYATQHLGTVGDYAKWNAGNVKRTQDIFDLGPRIKLRIP
jgi:hypothetical protein